VWLVLSALVVSKAREAGAGLSLEHNRQGFTFLIVCRIFSKPRPLQLIKGVASTFCPKVVGLAFLKEEADEEPLRAR
jgi:hypothetical protein